MGSSTVGLAWVAVVSAAEMVAAILRDKKKILPCCTYLQGEYGINDLYVGVPVKLGRKGIEQIMEISLSKEEETQLQKSAAAVQQLVDVLKENDYL